MSFLDSVLSSLQPGKPYQPLSQPPAPPATSSAKRDDRNLKTAPRQPAPGATANGRTKPKITPSTKNGTAGTASTAGPAAIKKPVPTKPAPSKPAPAPAKPPPKGSYADLMQQAKAMQDKAPVRLGTFQNSNVPQERISLRKRKRLWGEAKKKAKTEAKAKGKPHVPYAPEQGPEHKPYAKKRTPEKRSPDTTSYKGTAKPTKTPSPPVPAYRGTAGLPGSRGPNDRRAHGKRRLDEYLGTDEEDEGEYGEYDDFYSDASSDMEAGFDDVEEEEGVALKSARKEDEEELRLEMAAKKEKMQRQKLQRRV